MDHKKTLLEPFEIEQPRGRESRDSTIPGEHHYDSFLEYFMSLIGFAVGFGSFWRFPYLVFKNGGGAFLLCYFIAIGVFGIPLFYLETALGQMHQRSAPFVFSRLNKGLKMVDMTYMFVALHFASYYNIILAQCFRYLFSALDSPLPYAAESIFDNSYFPQKVLAASSSITEFGHVNPSLFALYAFSLFVCYLVLRNGVKITGKIVIGTASLPFVIFFILSVRGILLDGAAEGLYFLFLPDFQKLLSVEIWTDASVQAFYQCSIACSYVLNISSMKPRRQQFTSEIYLMPLAFITCGILCCISIFSFLGHFCREADLAINELELSGVSLSFNVFPKALAILPWANLWVFCFFLAMILLGIDSQFGFIESILCYVRNEVKEQGGSIRAWRFNLTYAVLEKLTFLLIFIFSPFVTSSAGIYYLSFFDRFGLGVPLPLGALIQYCLFVRVFPFSELSAQIEKYTGQQTPPWVKVLLESNLMLAALLLNVGFALINQVMHSSEYPWAWSLCGWVITSYPYILGWAYWQARKEPSTRVTFQQLNEE